MITPKFQKRHYQTLVKLTGQSVVATHGQVMIEPHLWLQNMIDYFARDNPHFKSDKFEEAFWEETRKCLDEQ